VLPPASAPWIPEVEAGPDDRPVRVQLSEIVSQLAEYYVEIAQRMSVLQFAGFGPEDLKGRYTELPPLRNIRIVSCWFERAAKRGLIRETDFSVVAMTVLSALHGPAMLTGFLGKHPTGHSADEYVNAVVDLILDGLNERSGEPDLLKAMATV